MKHLSLYILLCGTLLASTAQAVQIQNVAWHISMDEVRQQNDQKAVERNNLLIVQDQWGDYQITRKFEFISDKLVRTTIIFKDRYTDKSNYISDFHRFNRKLNEKYGEPQTSDARVTLNPAMANDSSTSSGKKLSSGAIGFETKWRTSKANVRHTLRGNNYEIIHVIVATSTEYKRLKQQLADDY